MEFVKVEKSQVMKGKGRTNLLEKLDEFVKMDAEVCEILFTEDEYVSDKVCAQTWRQAIKKYCYNNLCVSVRKGKVYIIRKDL